MTHSQFMTWFSIALISFSAIVALALMSGRFIVNNIEKIFRILTQLPDQFETVFDLIAKIVRSFALHHIFDWILSSFDNYRYSKKHLITYGQSSTIALSVLVILFYPDNLLVDESIMITIFALILLEKLYIIFKIKWVIYRTQQLEKKAVALSKQHLLEESVLQYSQALDLYQKPLLANNRALDTYRAELIEKIADFLHQYGALKRALLRYHQAIQIYQKPHLLRISTFDGERLRLREKVKTIAVQQKLGRWYVRTGWNSLDDTVSKRDFYESEKQLAENNHNDIKEDLQILDSFKDIMSETEFFEQQNIILKKHAKREMSYTTY